MCILGRIEGALNSKYKKKAQSNCLQYIYIYLSLKFALCSTFSIAPKLQIRTNFQLEKLLHLHSLFSRSAALKDFPNYTNKNEFKHTQQTTFECYLLSCCAQLH